jgi:hypothetical protein
MAKKSKEKSYWPHLILGFLIIGMTLSFWTVKSANSIPVQRVNDYMMSYQQADININEIRAKEDKFNKLYDININAKTIVVPVKHSKAKKSETAVVLKNGINTLEYIITTKDGKAASDLNVSFLLTRPNTTADDIKVDKIAFVNGKYIIKDINITKPGRYILQIKAQKDDAIGYKETPAYLAK